MKKKFRPEIEEAVQMMTYMDDTFMSVALEDPITAREAIRIAMEDELISIISCETQHRLSNLKGRSVIPDAHATQDDGHEYALEVQKDIYKAKLPRLLYDLHMMSTKTTETGDNLSHMKMKTVILFSEGDAFDSELTILKSEPWVECNDGIRRPIDIRFVRVNMKHTEGNRPVNQMARDWHRKEYDQIENPVFRKRMKELKEGDGKDIMCEIVEKLCRDREAEGIEKGNEQKAEAIAVRQLAKGRSLEEVCDIVESSEKTVRAWAQKAGLKL